jgi:hypothetical protein
LQLQLQLQFAVACPRLQALSLPTSFVWKWTIHKEFLEEGFR